MSHKVYFTACLPSESHLLKSKVHTLNISTMLYRSLCLQQVHMRTMTLSKSATFPNSHFYYGEVISIQSNLPNVIFHYMIKIYPFNDRKGSEVISVYFCQKNITLIQFSMCLPVHYFYMDQNSSFKFHITDNTLQISYCYN